jgi:hypothetical protein
MDKTAGGCGAPGPSGSSSNRVFTGKSDENIAAAKNPQPSGAAVNAKKTKKRGKFTYPQDYPLHVPDEIDSDTVWRWFHQYQIWQGRLVDAKKKTLFCGLCGFVSPGEKKILKHFLAEHGDKKFYECGFCEKAFCLRQNAVTHLDEVHCVSQQPWRWDWGPDEQQTELNDTGNDWPYGDDWRNRCDDDDSDSDEEKESDHEYTEEYVEGAEAESDPGSEGACEFDD